MTETPTHVTQAEEALARRRLRRQKRRRRAIIRRCVLGLCLLTALAVVLLCGRDKPPSDQEPALPQGPVILQNVVLPDWVDQQIVPVNGSGRRGMALEDIQDIVIHYVGNPGTTAQQNRDYYAQADTSVSSHFLIGLDGEVIQCVPLNEKSSASNHRNRDTISIEVCHPDETGIFNQASYDSLVKLTAFLCDLCGFDTGHIIRHFDVTGKECPLYFVKNEAAWTQFLQDVDTSLAALPS